MFKSVGLCLYMYMMGDTVALLVGHQTCDSQVAGSSHGWALPRSGQAN